MESSGGDAVRSMLAAARPRALGLSWWLIAIAVTAGTNLLDFFAAAQPHALRTSLFAAVTVVRVVLVFWLGYALIRQMAGLGRPGAITAAFARFSLFMIGSVVLAGVLTGLAAWIAGMGADKALAGVLAFLFVTVTTLVLVRLLAWQAALAVGDRELGAAGAWRALAGASSGLAVAYLVVALIAAAHAALTRLAVASAQSVPALAGLAFVDGLVSAAQLILGCALAVVAWRLARGHTETLREDTGLA